MKYRNLTNKYIN